MRRNFLDIFDAHLFREVEQNESAHVLRVATELCRGRTLKELDASGHVVREVAYEQLCVFSCHLAKRIFSLLPASNDANKVSWNCCLIEPVCLGDKILVHDKLILRGAFEK